MDRREALVRIGVFTGVGALAPLTLIACARPPDRPPVRTATGRRGDPTPIPKAPEPQASAEKGVIGNWRFIPVSVGDSTQGKPAEGHRKLEVAMAAFNLSNEPRGRTGREYPEDDAIRFHLQADNGFPYPPDGGFSLTNHMITTIAVPQHGLRASFSTDVPLTAKGLKLVASIQSDRRNPPKEPPKEVFSWDLGRDFPPFGQERNVDYFPAAAKFKRLGEALVQGPLEITPVKVLLTQLCGEGGYQSPLTGGLWYLLGQFRARNNYGYSLGHNQPGFQITDSRGQTLNTSAVTNTIPEVPPGMEKIFYAAIWASPTNGGCKPVSPPEEIRHLRLAVFLPPLARAKTEGAWGSYDIPSPTVIPPVIVPTSGFGRPDLTLPTVEKVFASIGK